MTNENKTCADPPYFAVRIIRVVFITLLRDREIVMRVGEG